VTSLTPPGNSSTYVNPDNTSDHQISIGDWVQGKPGVSNGKNVRDALDVLKEIDITVPVWDQTRGQRANTAYRVAGFVRVRLLSHQLPGQNRITARFLGMTTCETFNTAPIVNAGPDMTNSLHALPATVTLNGAASDERVSLESRSPRGHHTASRLVERAPRMRHPGAIRRASLKWAKL
jgi:hypothetical protein